MLQASGYVADIFATHSTDDGRGMQRVVCIEVCDIYIALLDGLFDKTFRGGFGR